jgi:hypothetical protein
MLPPRVLASFLVVLQLGALFHGPLAHLYRGDATVALVEHEETPGTAPHAGDCVLCRAGSLKLPSAPGPVVLVPAAVSTTPRPAALPVPHARIPVFPLGSRAPPLA